MELTRRGLIGVGFVALAGTAGCLGGESNVRYPAANRDPVGEGEEPLVGETTPADNDDTTANSVSESIPHESLARDTRHVVSELAWFGEEYESSVAAFREAVADAERETRAVRDLDTIGENELFRLRWAVERVGTAAQMQFGDHFPVAGVVDSVGSNHLEVIEKFAGRDDRDRLRTEIDRLADFLDGLRSRSYIDRHLSAHPVQNRLVDLLRGGPPSRSGPSLFAVYHSSTSFRSLAYDGDQVVDDRVPFPGEATIAEGEFAGLATPDRRRGVTVVRTYQPPDRDEWPMPLERQDDNDEDSEDDEDEDEEELREEYEEYLDDPFASVPPPELLDPRDFPVDGIHVQEYADVGTATDALESLLANGVTEEDRERLGGRDWRRLRYRHDGDVTYAFTLQAGAFLVSVSASETSWEERTTWREPLRRSWLL